MAQSKCSPQEFIRDSFTPQIGVLCSPTADDVCRKNNLSFIELLQPFCKLNSEVHYRDPNGASVSLKNLKISLVDVNSRPPQTTLARKFLNSSVSDAPTPRINTVKYGDYTLDVPASAPWFDAWRETFFNVQYPADHEFTKHFIACILVIATTENNPTKSMAQLVQTINHIQNVSVTKLPKWFNSNVLRYFVVLHETLVEHDVRVNETFETIKQSYGPQHCFLLKTNSQAPNTPGEQLPDPWSQFINSCVQVYGPSKNSTESSPNTSRSLSQSLELGQEVNEGSDNALSYHPLSPENDETAMQDSLLKQEVEEKKVEAPVLHGGCLSTEDVEQLKLLIHDFCTRALVPYVEKQVHLLSDFVANKKGVSKTLFSATKRWFTPNKPTSNSATINTLTYPFDAPELQIRRLGDLYFMFGHYSMAFQAYHSAKRDFMIDQAWLYYAGALEMAALAAFMANDSSRKSFDYMEESITTYLNTCKMAQFATRATLLSAECLKGYNLFGEAANQLIRMTSEESDLRSALLLEQASYCFLLCLRPAMVRKYAFHMVLAGHRFTKAAQRKHSLRCYKQAYQVYQDKGWNLAEDHIHCTMGRQANNLSELEEAVQSYGKLLTAESKQSQQQQSVFLKEYLTTHSALLKKQNNLLTPVLPLPVVKSETIKVLVGPTNPLRTPGKVPALGISIGNGDLKTMQKWNKLEEMLVQEAQGSLPMIFKPLMTLFTNENSSNLHPVAVIGEPIQISVELYNPLQILLNLKDIYLLWQFKDNNNRFAVNEIMGHNLDHTMKTHYIKSIVIQANCTQDAVLSITPLAVGEVLIKGICYSLVSSSSADAEITLRGKQVFAIKGPRVKKKDAPADFRPDKRLDIKIVPSAPCLQVSFREMNAELLRNELQEISVELRNIGSVPLHKIYMATSMPHLLSSCAFNEDTEEFIDVGNLESAAAREKEARKNHVSFLPLPNGVLEPGQYYNMVIWMKAPEVIGPTLIDLLIYYENVDSTSVPRYRLVRHMWQLSIQESIKVEVSAQQSCDSKEVEQLALTVKAINLNKVHHAILTEITILKAALLSANWELSQELVAPDTIKLESQASVYIFLKVLRKAYKRCKYSEITFGGNKPVTQHSNTAYLDFAKRNEQSRVNIFDSPDSSERVVRKHDATLILRWQACVTDSMGRKRTVYGQNDVPVDIVAPDIVAPVEDYQGPNYLFDRTSLDSNTVILDNSVTLDDKQVTYNLVHQPIVQHDFREGKLCIVPVRLLLHSVSDKQLVIKIHTLGTSSTTLPIQQRPTLFFPYSSKNFRWTNVGSIIRPIEPITSLSVQLAVAVPSAGTYDLGSRIEVWCHVADQPETAVLQTCRVQSSLIITSGNS